MWPSDLPVRGYQPPPPPRQRSLKHTWVSIKLFKTLVQRHTSGPSVGFLCHCVLEVPISAIHAEFSKGQEVSSMALTTPVRKPEMTAPGFPSWVDRAFPNRREDVRCCHGCHRRNIYPRRLLSEWVSRVFAAPPAPCHLPQWDLLASAAPWTASLP